MTRAQAATLSLCAALAVAGGARAQKADAPAVTAAPAPTSAAAPAPASGVRASHRVDVIGPGERIETVIDRLRGGARRGASAPVQAVVPADKLPLRAPDNKARGPDHPGDAPRGPDGSHAQPSGGGQPPDRPHR